MSTLVTPALTADAVTIADAILRSTNPAGDGPPEDRDALIAAVGELLRNGTITARTEPARVALTAKSAAALAAAALLDAGDIARDRPGADQVAELVAVAAGWRELAAAMSMYGPMQRDDDNEGSDR